VTLAIVHVDNHLLVVEKPPGQLTQGDATGDRPLQDDARQWLKDTYNKPGNVFVGLVHRLDRPVSGVVVLARTSKGASRLSAQFRARSVDKRYLAVVSGALCPPEQVLTHTLDGKRCRLELTVLARQDGASLLEVRPLTGRKHQIRRQLSLMGAPIVGDVRYGAAAPLPDRSIALHAAQITVEHPTQKERMTFRAAWPKRFHRLGFSEAQGVQRQ
jgi:23S rRNA pseudouridine1911/1915/1917 synthase